MTISFADRVQETTMTTGTGTVTLAGAVSGYQSFATALAVGATVYYVIAGNAQWEVGTGTLATATTLTRDTVLSSSNANTAVNFSTGTKTVWIDVPASFLAGLVSRFEQQWFFDGSDGDATVTTSITLTTDAYYNNLTLGPGGSLNTGGFKLFVKGTLDLVNAATGAIFATKSNGGNASGVNAGAAAAQLALRTWQASTAPVVGVAGGATNGTIGTANSAGGVMTGGRSGAAGAGGSGGSGTGGAAGTRNVATHYYPLRQLTLIPWGPQSGTGSPPRGGNDSPSGGSGAGDGTAGGGSGGGASGGGMVGIWARTIKRSSSNAATGIISAIGGNGGNGGTPAGGNRGGGGGAGGGGGGSVYIVCGELVGSSQANALDMSGGNGGNGGSGTGTGTSGGGGTGGDGGRVTLINLSTQTTTVFDGTGVAGTGPTGATGGAGATTRTSL